MYIRPLLDSVEEITVSTSTPGAESSGQGAAQIRMTTRAGSNRFTGSVYDTWRNQGGVSEDDVNTRSNKRGWLWRLNTPYWFNKRDRPRTAAGDYFIDDVRLETPGFRVGGPILPDRLFYFFNWEWFKWPNQVARTRYLASTDAQRGLFTYTANDGSRRTIDLLALAASRGQTATIDPTMSRLFSDIRSAAAGHTTGGSISSWDLNTDKFDYSPGGDQFRHFPTARIDYNVTPNHQLTATARYNRFESDPDILNSREPRFPGFANVGGQYSHRYMWSGTLRSTLGRNFVNEARYGFSGGTTQFFTNVTGPDADEQQVAISGQGAAERQRGEDHAERPEACDRAAPQQRPHDRRAHEQPEPGDERGRYQRSGDEHQELDHRRQPELGHQQQRDVKQRRDGEHERIRRRIDVHAAALGAVAEGAMGRVPGDGDERVRHERPHASSPALGALEHEGVCREVPEARQRRLGGQKTQRERAGPGDDAGGPAAGTPVVMREQGEHAEHGADQSVSRRDPADAGGVGVVDGEQEQREAGDPRPPSVIRGQRSIRTTDHEDQEHVPQNAVQVHPPRRSGAVDGQRRGRERAKEADLQVVGGPPREGPAGAPLDDLGGPAEVVERGDAARRVVQVLAQEQVVERQAACQRGQAQQESEQRQQDEHAWARQPAPNSGREGSRTRGLRRSHARE
jgi:hypothetical protein